MSGIFDPIRDLIKDHADVPRPLRPATVVDTARWSDTGAAWIGVRVAGEYRQAILRDSAAPTVGDTVYVALTDAGHAPYLAYPLPGATHHGYVYVSARDVSGEMGGEWAVLRFDAFGYHWTKRSTSPVAGTWDRRPIRGIAGFRLFTYGCSDSGVGSEAFYSDDAGTTWHSTGLLGVLDIQVQAVNLAGAHGSMAAVAANGTKIYASADWGATWGEVPAYETTGAHYYAATYVGSYFFIAALSRLGVYVPDGFGGVLGPILPISDDGGAIASYVGASGDWLQIPGGVMETETDAQYKAGIADGGDISGTGSPVAGGPHAGAWLGFEPYMHTDGSGGRAYHVETYGVTVMYDGATNHPDSLAAGVRGYVNVVGSGDGVLPDDWPPTTGDEGGFRFVAVDSDDPDAALYAIEVGSAFFPFSTPTEPWEVADAHMLADLGARYAASMQGCATLEVWDENFGHV